MKRILLRTLVIIAAVLVASCAKEKKEKQESRKNLPATEEVHIDGDKDLDITESKSEVIFDNEVVDKVYAQYLMIKKGLVNSNAKLVQQEAKKMEELLGDSEENKQLNATVKLISLTKEIKKQRDFFVTLTSETEKLINKSAITSGEVYKQFCPMAFDGNGGYWLSNSKEIRNPYYGNQMLKCGSVNETIK
ncbi:DUF3347 domain-containing protein [Aquimarina litoralis]|uniref:DUF3347 domain-containing protein n=1 Tax=Aquimarina litoralis TaxID=584605 RepID=UPI001C55FB13|nr:DUF3347 domain-containing protein [Aquimarina litoralis]MBW1295490.1 DUF3347 domain-containing protein [Aquimarina litoralis]